MNIFVLKDIFFIQEKIDPQSTLARGANQSPQINGNHVIALHLEVFPGTVEGTLQDGIEIVGWSVLGFFERSFVVLVVKFLKHLGGFKEVSSFGKLFFFFWGECFSSPSWAGIFVTAREIGGFMIQFEEHIFQMGWNSTTN